MNRTCDLTISREDYDLLQAHLFPGDGDEHGAVLRAGVVRTNERLRLVVQHVALAQFGSDYVVGTIGHRALHPTFIHRQIVACRDQGLAYLAAHNHNADDRVRFSAIDIASHERGYPALLDIGKGVPVGALVFGRRSVEADLWLPGGERLSLGECRVVGGTLERLYPQPPSWQPIDKSFDRQVRMFGAKGQAVLKHSKVAVIGLGGIGSLVAEFLARLGIGELVLVDPDVIEDTNLSRVVGAADTDLAGPALKTGIAVRHVHESRPDIGVEAIADDLAKHAVSMRLRDCDYIFLAADSMRARLVFNALVHQYGIPGVQLGAKVRPGKDGLLAEAMAAVRHVRPGTGCLWCNQLIDPTQLALEAKTDQERRDQAYGTSEPNPSVITLNAVSAAHAVNDFLFYYLGMKSEPAAGDFQHFHFLTGKSPYVVPRRDADCGECSREGRYGRGDAMQLPGIDS